MQESEFIVEKDVPAPTSRRRRWAFMEQLEVGDSFVCTEKDARTAFTVARNCGIVVSMRTVPRKVEGAKKRVRVWRVA